MLRSRYAVPVAAMGLLVQAILASAVPARAADALPPFSRVQWVVAAYFQDHRGFESNDLISRSQVDAILAELERQNWKVADAQKIRASVLADGDYLVQQLRTPDGTRFMRKISGQPLAYDRLDQIARMPGGELMLKDFLRFPNSEVSFSSGGALPFDRLPRLTPGNQRRGTDLDKPTGRIYTAAQLVARLKSSYDAEAARRNGAAP